jgi:mRNA interferase MazF
VIYQQGDILKVSMDPPQGHEQAGYRPVLVLQRTEVSNLLNSVVIIAPISNSLTRLPFEVALDARTATTGHVLCRQIRALDLRKRETRFVERAPDDIVKQCIELVNALIEFEAK